MNQLGPDESEPARDLPWGWQYYRTCQGSWLVSGNLVLPILSRCTYYLVGHYQNLRSLCAGAKWAGDTGV